MRDSSLVKLASGRLLSMVESLLVCFSSDAYISFVTLSVF